MQNTKLWGPEMTQALLDLSNGTEKLSATGIARILSARFEVTCSRNAVLGKWHRFRHPTIPAPPRPPAKSLSPEYSTLKSIKGLCRSRYGGRGITVCARWVNSFEAFLADMGPKPSPQHVLARIDKAGNFEPSNCRWATMAEANKNPTRMKRSKPLTHPRTAYRAPGSKIRQKSGAN
jgi:hypothetical protein